MAEPLLLSTWSFGRPANAAAWPALAAGGSALDAAERVARHAEADPHNHTVGVGGWPDAGGEVSLDAAIMTAPAQCGAVANVRRFGHPVSIARKVMETTPHVLLAGAEADAFAAAAGFEPATLLTETARRDWQAWREAGGEAGGAQRNIEARAGVDSHDTIGVIACDRHARLAVACTTSGLAWKLPGRVGDTPIVGHGLYADPAVGAAVATGHGELAMATCASFLAIELLRQGSTPSGAARAVLERVASSCPLNEDDQLGLIVCTRSGEWYGAALRSGFDVAVRTASRDELEPASFVLLTD